MAEQTLGVTFPETYRRFLNDFGTTGIGGFEVYGVIQEDFVNSGIPDGIWYTLRSRENMQLGPSYVLVESGGDGTYVAIDTSSRDADGECPLVRVWLDGKAFEHVSDNFGTWLLEELQWRLAEEA